jgi:hypothetical protein
MSRKAIINEVYYADGTGAMQLKSTTGWSHELKSQVFMTPSGQVVVGRYVIEHI